MLLHFLLIRVLQLIANCYILVIRCIFSVINLYFYILVALCVHVDIY